MPAARTSRLQLANRTNRVPSSVTSTTPTGAARIPPTAATAVASLIGLLPAAAEAATEAVGDPGDGDDGRAADLDRLAVDPADAGAVTQPAHEAVGGFDHIHSRSRLVSFECVATHGWLAA